MPKITSEIDIMYDRGDIVVFNRGDALLIGIISGYAVDWEAGRSVWYDIIINEKTTLNYTTGDIAEWNILGKFDDPMMSTKIRQFMSDGKFD